MVRDGVFLYRYPGTTYLATVMLSLRDRSSLIQMTRISSLFHHQLIEPCFFSIDAGFQQHPLRWIPAVFPDRKSGGFMFNFLVKTFQGEPV
jgi:hypothetical protein